jgi:hypothetical protein
MLGSTRRRRRRIRTRGLSTKRVFLTGHSLGGAVAALSAPLLGFACPRTLFGSPRYCDAAMLASDTAGPVRNFRRDADLVPLLPPKRLGYADIPDELTTGGQPYLRLERFRLRNLFLGPWISFAQASARPHKMELYRAEIGQAAGAKLCAEPLTSSLLIRPADVATPRN